MFCCYEDYFSKEFCAKNLFHSISFMLNKIILEMVSIATKVLCLFTPRKNKENMIKILRGNNVNTRYLIFTIFSTGNFYEKLTISYENIDFNYKEFMLCIWLIVSR